MSVWDILTNYYPAFLTGLSVTLKLCAIIWGSGLILGGALGLAGNKFPRGVGFPSHGVSFFLGGVPLLVFLFWLHYPVQAMFNVVIDPFYTAAFTLAIVNIFAVADIIRGALNDFPQQYLIAAKVTGLTRKQTIFKIQLPLILREVMPPLLLLQVAMLHITLFSSLISVEEIFRVAQRINAQIYRPVEIYTALGVFFLAVCLPINGLALWLKSRFTRNLSEQ
ncbi:MAG: ABC transporter permease subunit [Alphaproteobacteria bacterium]|jgi:ABC-type amino acid transport system permease subunit|nr:ABC transporter permease subunit [Alphaproteobacteria bacterium]MCB1550688.1 ABC transporter permease subunit [Alphaproteobacteria bacterium]MCB9985353.1 ABC transporter permease subunit [Micavibrio sp.]HRK98133.1 ABC transporter permease subunit [Alphaproteobacteria bacterium]